MIMKNEVKPLVSFILLAYNQEKYIKYAVASVLSQNYYPLEIIVSDDCSKDGTYQVILDVLRNIDCNRKIIVNRNTENQGTIPHLNKLIEMSSGEFIVLAAGDDISLPSRTEILVNEWLRLDKKVCSIFTNAIVINDSGAEKGPFFDQPKIIKNIDDFVKFGNCWLGGFSHGFSRQLYDKYGPIKCDTFQEDGVLSFRAILNEGVYYCEECTVLYRRHEENSYDTANLNKLKKLYKSELGLAEQRILDLEMDVNIDVQNRVRLKSILSTTAKNKKLYIDFPYLITLTFMIRKFKTILLSKFIKVLFKK